MVAVGEAPAPVSEHQTEHVGEHAGEPYAAVIRTMELRIDGTGQQYLLVRVFRRAHPGAVDYWDGNWLEVQIEARIGAWSGQYDAYLRVDEFISFREEIEKLQAGAVPKARFESMEGQLKLTLRHDQRSRLVIDGVARDAAGYGNVLRFKEWEVDQEQPGRIVTQLADIENEFPSRGTPDE